MLLVLTKVMAERYVEYNLYVGSFENKKCDKIKINLCVDQKKVPIFHLGELSKYYTFLSPSLEK